jgi:hypothetical protein
MGGRVVLVLGALAFSCGGQSETDDASRDGDAGDSGLETGGASAIGGTGPTGGTNSTGGTIATGGTNSTGGTNPTGGTVATGGTSTGGSAGIPGGFSRDAERIGGAWSSAVVDRCRLCNAEGAEGCIREDGTLVPSPFLLICLSQLATTDTEVAAFLAQWAASAESAAAAWRTACDVIPPLPPPPELPASAARCASRDFGCPEFRTATACDGVAECLSGEDERFCGPITDDFTCHHGETFRWNRICDGLPDCEFGEDERTCPAVPAP